MLNSRFEGHLPGHGVRDASVLCAAPGCRVRDLNKTEINTLRPGQNGRQ